jgi:ribosomal protein L21E
MKAGDLVRLFGDGDMGVIVRIDESIDNGHFVQFFSGAVVGYPSIWLGLVNEYGQSVEAN